MRKPKSVNISFLILVLLFVLSQTAFALSATLTNTMENDQNDSQEEFTPLSDNNISDPVLSYEDKPFSDIEELMFEKKIIRQILKEKAEKLTVSKNTAQDQILTLATDTAAMEANETETETAEPSQPEATPATTPKPQIKGVVKWVNANQLNVREEPTSNSKLVQTIGRGDRVTYYETIGEWARIITWQDRKGYVLAKYLVNSANEVVQVKQTSPDRGTSTTSTPSPQSSEGQSLAQQVVSYAKTLLGVKYVWGGNSKSGLDCSGLTKYVYSHFGINVPRSSGSYWSFGTKIARSDLKAGDIVLFDTNGGAADVSHVGIYLGDGTFIHASSSKGKVVIQNLNSYRAKYMGARRVIK
ncbi:MAG: SH3 domain-containing protein [Clostridiaceae bacterium]|nr:SH3 domain-containing protein [Clostridiaceae bacterium]